MSDWSPIISRRGFLTGGVATVTALAGCGFRGSESDTETTPAPESPLERILVRSDTGSTEQIRLTLVYGPSEGHTERPVWTTVDAPADGEPETVVRSLETGAGIYSLTAASVRHGNHEVISFNSRMSDGSSQFEVVVGKNGDVSVNRNHSGEPMATR